MYNLTTSEITLDVVAATCISRVIDQEIERVEKLVDKATEKERRTGVPRSAQAEKTRNYLANLQRARDAYDPVYREVIAAPMFTDEYQAVIDNALANK
jgi:hypothetical protein